MKIVHTQTLLPAALVGAIALVVIALNPAPATAEDLSLRNGDILTYN